MTEAYSIPTHFGGNPPNTDQLSAEIANSSIAIAVDRIDRLGDEVFIVFQSQISAGDKTTLNGLVSAHTPITHFVSTSPIFDAVVDSTDNGDYLLPSAAFAAGAK